MTSLALAVLVVGAAGCSKNEATADAMENKADKVRDAGR